MTRPCLTLDLSSAPNQRTALVHQPSVIAAFVHLCSCGGARRDMLILGQKSGLVYAFDASTRVRPDHKRQQHSVQGAS